MFFVFACLFLFCYIFDLTITRNINLTTLPFDLSLKGNLKIYFGVVRGSLEASVYFRLSMANVKVLV